MSKTSTDQTAADKREQYSRNTSSSAGSFRSDPATMRRVAGKYDLNAEAEVRNWIQQLTGENIGQYELEKRLKDGVILCKLMQRLYQGTPADALPPKCKTTNPKARQSDKAAIQMENIEIFLKCANAYGVPQSGLFACVDLFEGRNMPMVIATILQVGSEAQRLKFDGPTCGPKPLPKKQKNKFTREQLRGGNAILSLQHGTNKFASQKGMAFGSVRHCADIRADDLSQDGQGEIHLQSGTNKFASQKGMSFGAIRHISDIKADDMCKEGEGEITLQAGTNKFASQKGMAFGAVRHCADIRADEYDQTSQSEVGLQMGSNKFASQKGMRIGAVRHVSDIKADDINQEGQKEVGLQMGSNKFASQKGMSFGAVRHVADIRADDMTQESSGHINLQSGWNKGASQSGMRGFGASRHVSDIKVTELADELEFSDEEGAVNEEEYEQE